MTLDEFNIDWKRMFMVDSEIGGSDQPLTEILKSCAGQSKGGLLFYGAGFYDGELLILRCDDDNNCYRRIKNTGDDEQDWELFGYLISPMG